MPPTIGIELELNLIDRQGYLKNNALDILADRRVKEAGCYKDEGTRAQVEVNSSPASTIYHLHQDLHQKLSFLEKVCQEYGSFLVPASEYGAGSGELVGQDGTDPRTNIYLQTLGEEALSSLVHHSGIHLHVSQTPGKKLQQFWLLQALDALTYAFTSTSPISYRGKNGLNCHRINNQRNIAFREFPLHAQLQDYPYSLDEIEERNKQRWQQWFQIVVEKNMSAEIYQENFRPDNTGYHYIRKRDSIGPTGTWEVRSFDTAPLDILCAAATFVKGVHDYVINRNVLLAIADEFGKYKFTEKQVVLPNLETLKTMEKEAIRSGLQSDLVFAYFQSLFPLAEQGLLPEDQPYLQPVRQMLQTRINPANQIMQYMKNLGYTGSEFSPNQAAQANLFMRNWHLQSLQD